MFAKNLVITFFAIVPLCRYRNLQLKFLDFYASSLLVCFIVRTFCYILQFFTSYVLVILMMKFAFMWLLLLLNHRELITHLKVSACVLASLPASA